MKWIINDGEKDQEFLIILRDGSSAVANINDIADITDLQNAIKSIYRICHGIPVQGKISFYQTDRTLAIFIHGPDKVLWAKSVVWI